MALTLIISVRWKFLYRSTLCETKEELKFQFWPHDPEVESKSENLLPSTVSSTNKQTDRQTDQEIQSRVHPVLS